MSFWLSLMLRRAALAELDLVDRQIAVVRELIELRETIKEAEADCWWAAEQLAMLGHTAEIEEMERRWYGRKGT